MVNDGEVIVTMYQVVIGDVLSAVTGTRWRME